MSCNKNCNPTTKDTRTHTQVTKSDLEKREEINSSQQHHNIDMNEAQTLEDVMCNMNNVHNSVC